MLTDDLSLQISNLVINEHREQILNIRHQAYSEDYGTSFNKKGIDWNSVDERSTHLGFFIKNELVSYLRLTISNDHNDFNLILLHNPPDKFVGPFGFLARAATLQNYRNHHLHTRLRAAAIKLCLDENVQSLWGTLPTSALRISQLKELEYDLEEVTLNNSSFLNINKVKIASLVGTEKIQKTYRHLLKRIDLNKLEFTREP